VNGAGIKYFHANSTLADSTATGANSVAIGPAAVATNAGDVALGYGSTTAPAVATTGVTLRGTTFAYAGASPVSTVSVGAPGAERTITNVAAGQVTSTSTDAVNGSQLYATDQTVNSLVAGTGGAFVADNTAGAGVPTAGGANSVAGGFGANASGANSAAVGSNATASGTGSTVLGSGANDGGNAGSTVIGQGAGVAPSTSGSNVALGQGSTVTSAPVSTSGATIAGAAYAGFAGSVATGTVSLGSAGSERTLTNLAAGQVTATSTDAVNGSELYAVASTSQSGIGSLSTGLSSVGSNVTQLSTGLSTVNSNVNIFSADANGAGIKYFHANSTLADSTATGTDSVAIGPVAVASGAQSVVIGSGATDNANAGSVVIGQGASITSGVGGSNVALGVGSAVTAAAVGTSSISVDGTTYAGFAGANPIGVVSVGSASGPRVITGVAAGAITATSLDAVNGSELYSVTNQVSQTAATVAANLGGGSTSVNGAVTAPTYQVAGSTATTVSQAIAAVQQSSPIQYATSTGTGAIIVGNASTTAPTNTVTFVGTTTSSPVTVANVAAGSAPSDAVNVSQLASTQAHYFSVNDGTSPNGAISSTGAVTTTTPTGAAANYNNSGATGQYAVAISPNATATATGDVALGFGATASGTTTGAAVSVGMGNTAEGTGAVALGDPNVGIGTGAVAIGANNTALGDGSVAIGNISSAQGAGSIALGNNAIALNAGDVALGSGAITAAANPTSGIIINGANFAFAGANPASVVSVGAPGAERQITNVAAGQISATSTDAVNGSELYAVDQAVTALGSTVSSLGSGGAGVASLSTSASTGIGSNATSLASLSTSASTGIGANASSVAALSTGVARGTTGLVQQVGGAPGAGAITVGAQTGGTSVNIAGTSGARTLSGVAAGVAATDAVDVGQLLAALAGVSTNAVQYDNASRNSVTLGGAGAASPVALNNVAAGQVAAGSTQAVNGGQLYAANSNITNLQNGAAGAFQVYQSGAVTAPVASGLQSTAGGDGAVATGGAATAIGYHATASGLNSVAIGANSSDGGLANVVSFGTPGNERRLTNVAPGVNGTDAVNVNQLVGAEQTWQQGLDQFVQRADAGVALSLAASGLHYDSAPGTTSVAGAAAYYASHAGLSFGINHTSADGRWRYNIATTFASPTDGSDVGVVAGFTYTFGH
jgi:autotransporter adhesin